MLSALANCTESGEVCNLEMVKPGTVDVGRAPHLRLSLSPTPVGSDLAAHSALQIDAQVPFDFTKLTH